MKHKTKKKDRLLNEITENHQLHVQTEKYQNLATQILHLSNQTVNKTDFIKSILIFMKIVTGFEAVGIRLREGEDFPYYETIGFSRDFVKAERYLCARDQTGELIRNSEGNPYLECMCGNIICGRTNPSLPFFTESGSFWTNSTTELLASTTKGDRQGRTRNRCNSEGYESVALIPLRYDKEIIGLLQLNGRRKNIFTSNLISFFEEVGSSIGIVLEFKQTYDNITQPKQNVNTIDDTIITFHDKNFNIIRANKSAKKILKLPPLEGREVKCYQYYHGKDSPPKKCPSCKCLLTKEPAIFELFEPHLSKCIEIRAFPQFDRDGEFTGLIHFVRDTTDKHILSNKCCE
jgi:GAF domain-containing protein